MLSGHGTLASWAVIDVIKIAPLVDPGRIIILSVGVGTGPV